MSVSVYIICAEFLSLYTLSTLHALSVSSTSCEIIMLTPILIKQNRKTNTSTRVRDFSRNRYLVSTGKRIKTQNQFQNYIAFY